MGKIKKILENELIGGTQNTDVYPVTSTKAVYDTSNKVLDDYIQHLKKTSTFGGIAIPTTNPGTPDGNIFYLAVEAGTYANFSGIKIATGEVAILEWRGSWVKKVTGLATKAEIDAAIANLITQKVTPEMLSDTTLQLIQSSGGGTITNLPDDEDIESKENQLGVKVLKFANRKYNALNFSGKGYKILRKNIIDGKNVLSQDVINDENTIYEIRYDFDLQTETINIPNNSILKFNGGSINNGIINGNNTFLRGEVSCLYNISLIGTYVNNELYANWYKLYIDGATDDTKQLRLACSSTIPTIILPVGKMLITDYIFKTDKIKSIKGSIIENMQNSQGRHLTTLIFDNENIENGLIISDSTNTSRRFNIENIDVEFVKEGSVIYVKNDVVGLTYLNVIGVNVYYRNPYIISSNSAELTISGNNSAVFWLRHSFETYFDKIGIMGAKYGWVFDTSSHQDFVDDVYVSNIRGQAGIMFYNKGQFRGNTNITNIECENFAENLIRNDGGNISITGLHLENASDSSAFDFHDINIVEKTETVDENNVTKIALKFDTSINKKIIPGNIVEIYNDNISKFLLVESIIDDFTIRTNLRVFHTDVTNWHLKRYVRIPIIGYGSNYIDGFIGTGRKQPCAVIFDRGTLQTWQSCNDSGNDYKLPIYENTGWVTSYNSYKTHYNVPNTMIGSAFSELTTNKSLIDYNLYKLSPLGWKTNRTNFDLVWARHNSYQGYIEYIPILYDANIREYVSSTMINENVQSMVRGYFKCTVFIYAFREKEVELRINGDGLSYPGTIISKKFNVKQGINRIDLPFIKLDNKVKNLGIFLNKEPDAGIINANFIFSDSIAYNEGVFSEKPKNVEVGFQYFCTDKQTSEGNNDGIVIYHKGNNVWVDALGRVVS